MRFIPYPLENGNTGGFPGVAEATEIPLSKQVKRASISSKRRPRFLQPSTLFLKRSLGGYKPACEKMGTRKGPFGASGT